METDLNKHPRGKPNGNACAKSECDLMKKESILMNRPRKLNSNKVYLWLGFGGHNQGGKVVENILKNIWEKM